jgi:hypothetical protein
MNWGTKLKKAVFSSIAVGLAIQMGTFTILVDSVLAAAMNMPAGTTVITQLDERVSTKTHRVGDTVKMSVVVPVNVNGTVLIDQGAAVIAEVLALKKPGSVGNPGSLEVRVKSVRAVDGTLVPLAPETKRAEGEGKQGQSVILTLLCCVLFLLQKGENAEVAAGTQVITATLAPVSISVE